MSGWIKLQRQILDHWIAQDNEYLAVWVRMLAEANFDSRKTVIGGVLVEVQRGQLIFGLESYSAKTGVSIRRLRKLLELLESDRMIDRQKNNKFSLITIANYEKHQDEGRQESGKRQAQGNQTSSAGQAQGNTIRSKELNKENTVDSDEPTSASVDFISGEFDRFWRNYPYKKSKVTASKAFAKLVKGKKEGQVKFWVDMILNYHHGCIERQDIGADKLHAATLLNQKRWDDDPEFVKEFKKEWLNEHGKS